jgi:ATP-dependent protease Clp ATPase subunit
VSDRIYCSFCGGSNHERDLMLAGSGRIFICDICVEDAVRVIAETRRDRAMFGEVARCAWCTPAPVRLNGGV